MLEAIDAGYSLILFPEGTRGKSEQMGKIKSGIARILSLRPEVKYIPVFMTGMGRSLPKGKNDTATLQSIRLLRYTHIGKEYRYT